MFVQVIRGNAKDAPGMRKEMDRWQEELAPGAIGYLGSTGGVTDDGKFIVLARFESEEAAQKNSERPEQDAWYQEFATHLEGEPTFMNSTEIDEWMGGGSDDAGFVQIITGSVTDKDKMREMMTGMDDEIQKMRPDVMGGLVVWNDKDFVQSVYFTSEKEARSGESQEVPAEAQEQMQAMDSLMQNVEYLDLTDPKMFSKS